MGLGRDIAVPGTGVEMWAWGCGRQGQVSRERIRENERGKEKKRKENTKNRDIIGTSLFCTLGESVLPSDLPKQIQLYQQSSVSPSVSSFQGGC